MPQNRIMQALYATPEWVCFFMHFNFGSKEQTERKISADIHPKAEIRLRLGQNNFDLPKTKTKFWPIF